LTAREAVEKVLADAAGRPPPASTYRLQLGPDLDFRGAAALCPYLADLGVTHVYLSPILEAKPGSAHGYDVVDHNALRGELGGEAGYAALVDACRAHDLEIVLDFVPNHMGIGRENAWWQDVLENGPSSVHAPVFDIEWRPVKDELLYKVLIPTLGDQFGEVLERGELRLEREGGAFHIAYFDHRFPVAPRSVPRILGHRLPELRAQLGEDDLGVADLLSIMTALDKLPLRHVVEPETVAERAREKEVAKRRLAALFEARPAIRDFVDENVRLLNGTVGDPRSFDALEALLASVAFRLAHWRVAGEEINYRRFFDINDLAAIRMEDEQVFARTHRLLFALLTDGRAHALRIDHPDGLYQPTGYFRKLQEAWIEAAVERAAPGAPREEIAAEARRGLEAARRPPLTVVVEKILGPGERIPTSWAVGGTTGYDFLGAASGLFVAREHAHAMTAIYRGFTGERVSFADLVYACKHLIMSSSMASEINMLSHRLNRLSEANRKTRDFTLNSLAAAVAEYVACLPVYRTYVEGAAAAEIDARDRRYVETTIAAAKRRASSLNASVFDFLRDVLLLRLPDPLSDEQRRDAVEFVRKLQQVTGPVTAKAVEDTAFYRYLRLASLCEVGGDPEIFGTSPDAFHRLCLERLERWPLSFNSTSTHDTKRSEDVRLRISALSEVPGEWRQLLRRLARLSRGLKAQVDGRLCPDRNEEILLYQTLIGAFPDDGRIDDAFVGRIQAYMEKALREAKVHTTWTNPDAAYDDGVRRFVAAVLRSPAILAEILPFQQRVAAAGRIAALSLTALKIAAPGVTDVYQGTELHDLSLVDPDNRRPVDHGLRRRLLAEIAERTSSAEGRRAFAREAAGRADGAAKLLLLREGLRLRRAERQLFHGGAHVPLAVEGRDARHVLAFARADGARACVCVAPRFLLSKTTDGWDARVRLGELAGGGLRCVVSGAEVAPQGTSLGVAECFDAFPVAVLVR
jgi:(1->4)-alpha-D-glucan 1-alpha-D-glucosylmutase